MRYLNNPARLWAEQQAEAEGEAFEHAVERLLKRNKELEEENKDLRERLSRTQEEEYE